MGRSAPDVLPQPRPMWPVLGNLAQLNFERPLQSFMSIAEHYGEIVRLDFPNTTIILIGSQRLAAEVCDERRFHKIVGGPLKELRAVGGDGLFTAYHGEPNWELAHRVLLPAFSPRAMRDYFDDMLGLVDLMLERWAHMGPEAELDVADTMTRLTLDTIALCGFGFRFNSFYHDAMHPFVDAMMIALRESARRVGRPKLLTALGQGTQRRYREAIATMNATVDEVIAHRRASGVAGHDLLGRMLSGVDPETGRTLDDLNIRYQIITFLIAGHETTSGLLSFALYLLERHPDLLAAAQREVDRVFGPDTAVLPRFEQMAELDLIGRILKETLRLWPTAPLFTVTPYEPTRIADGRYEVLPGQRLGVLIPTVHRDATVWHEPERFDPDRFLPEREAALPRLAYTPFGQGARACIGRQFAMQEATLALAMLLHRFDIEGDPDYELDVKEALTIKPLGFTLRARPRTPERVRATRAATPSQALHDGAPAAHHGTPALVLYGSNMGSSQELAAELAQEAAQRGYVSRIATLDEASGALPTEGLTMIVSASYNGQPPDNAKAFCAWLDDAPPLKGVRYVVFGCGHRDWAQTYQSVPRRIDRQLEACGASRIGPRGEADGGGDYFSDIDTWREALWPTLADALELEATELSAGPGLTLSRWSQASELLDAHAEHVTVAVRRDLVDMRREGARRKVHLELDLPASMRYRCGDQLAVMAQNSLADVTQVAEHFGVDLDEHVVLEGGAGRALPLSRPIRVRELLSRYVDLREVASPRQIRAIAAATPCPPERAALERLVSDDRSIYQAEVMHQRRRPLDLLAASCQLDLGGFLDLLSPMRPRLYSINTAPQTSPDRVGLTISVAEGPRRGLCSGYLAELDPGARLVASLRRPSTASAPPEDPRCAMLMISAGSGIAPHRALLQWRRAQAERGVELGPAMLVFGCDHPDIDLIYGAELRRAERDGLVTLCCAFSCATDGDRRYVQHALAEEAEAVTALLRQGARIYVCGDGRHMGPAVREVLAGLAHRAGLGDDAWLGELIATGRYVNDVWAG